MKRIKILFVISNSSLSGAESQLLFLAKNLDKKKYDVEICCLESEGDFTKAAINIGLKIHIIEKKMRFDLYRLYKLTQLIKFKKFDIVNSYTWSANQYARLAKLFVNFKLVSAERGRSLGIKNLENFIDKLLFPLSDLVIFNSNIQKNKFLSHNNVLDNNIKFIPNCINVGGFSQKRKNKLKRLIGLNDNSTLIGTVGNFSKPKNFDMFIDLCESMKTTHGNFHFIAIGTGPRKMIYENIIKEKKLGSHISLIGRREDLNKIFCELDIFILTSNQEGMPNVILEAFASKVIVLTTKVDGCEELIKNNVNGFLVEPNDTKKMLRKIHYIIKNELEIKKIVNRAHRDLSKKYSINKMVEKYDYQYREIMND